MAHAQGRSDSPRGLYKSRRSAGKKPSRRRVPQSRRSRVQASRGQDRDQEPIRRRMNAFLSRSFGGHLFLVPLWRFLSSAVFAAGRKIKRKRKEKDFRRGKRVGFAVVFGWSVGCLLGSPGLRAAPIF